MLVVSTTVRTRRGVSGSMVMTQVELIYVFGAQIGVMPQDSLLFDGSVLSNIALTRPDTVFEEMVLASQVACT